MAYFDIHKEIQCLKTAGISLKVASNINIDLSYNWQDFGVTKYKKDKNDDRPDKNRYNGHSVMTGIRFDL